MNKVKEVYRVHKEIPRIFQPFIFDILTKCHHRKRLLEYFKIAKKLGVKVESINFSSFLLSLSLGQNNHNPENFNRILIDISQVELKQEYGFSMRRERGKL